MVFGRNFCEKRQIWVPEPHFWEVRGDTRLWLWLVRKPMVDFLFALMNFFRYLLRFRSYAAKCVQLGCFHRGSTSLHSNFTWTGSSPINHSWRKKTRDTGLPDGEDRIPLCSLVLTQYRSVTDGQMDRQTDGRICRTYRALAKLPSRRAAKTLQPPHFFCSYKKYISR